MMSESTESMGGDFAVGRVLYVADVAKILRVSLSSARAYLVELEERFEGELVHRRGTKLFITERALNLALSGKAIEPSVRRHLAALDRQVRRLTERLRAVEGQHGVLPLSENEDS
jgi:hypothetical protein